MTARTFDDALANLRRAYAVGLAGGRTVAGTPHEEASEAKGLWDRARGLAGSEAFDYVEGNPNRSPDADEHPALA